MARRVVLAADREEEAGEQAQPHFLRRGGEDIGVERGDREGVNGDGSNDETVNGSVNCIGSAGEASGGSGKRLGVDPRCRQGREEPAHADAEEARVAVHRIFVSREPGTQGRRGEADARHGKEGPGKDEAVEVDLAAHGGKAEDAGAALEAHQEGLGLVVEAVGGKEVRRAGLACCGDEEPVAGVAGGGLDVPLRLRSSPGEDARLDAPRSRNGDDARGDSVGPGAQAVINGEDDDPGPFPGRAPVVSRGKKGKGVAPAGNGEHDRRRPGERGEKVGDLSFG